MIKPSAAEFIGRFDVGYNSGTNSFRAKRFRIFLDLVAEVQARQSVCRIIDIGGTVGYWEAFLPDYATRPIEITIVNLYAEEAVKGNMRVVRGDACKIDSFADNAFDIVHSNSTIEHVGGWSDMKSMAREVRRLAPAYYLQVPYFWFPMEPHFQTLFIHWLPRSVQLSMIMKRRRGHWDRARTVNEGMIAVDGAILPDRRMVAELFPDAEIRSERFFGLTKSLIALRRPLLTTPEAAR